MKNKNILFSMVITLVVVLLASAVSVYAVKARVENLQEQIETNKEIVSQIQHTKEQLHNAAEALRLPHINDENLASQLSQKWIEIDAIEKETSIQTEEMTKKLEKLQGRYLGNFELTAYCYGNVTATGTTPTANRTIAVDPKVIPYGSKVRIEGYGTYIAEDCGGAVKGNIIDIYIPGYENCINFGRRTAKVYLIE